MLISGFFHLFSQLTKPHLEIVISVYIYLFFLVIYSILHLHFTLYFSEIVVVQKLKFVASATFAGLLKGVEGSEFVAEHIVLDIGQQKTYFCYFLIFLPYFSQISADKLKPKFPLLLNLFLLLIQTKFNQLIPHLLTPTQLSCLFTMKNMHIQYSLQHNEIVLLIPAVNQSNTFVIIDETLAT